MSAGSNLKDAVATLQNSSAALNVAVSAHVSNVSTLISDTDAQQAADTINAVALQLSAVAGQLK